MREISDAIHEGAMAFLKREYVVLLVFVAIVFVLLYIGISAQTATAFLGGGGMFCCCRVYRHESGNTGKC
jgi:K(+)-stimulated pyrophosphate-energized sodium pump